MSIFSESQIDRIVDEYGFKKRHESVEKLLYDLHISQMITDESQCCIRGGLGFLLNIKESDAMRLSMDVDMFSKLSKPDITQQIMKMAKKHDVDCVPSKSPSIPPIDNFVRFDISYASCYEKTNQIELDVIYGTTVNLPCRKIPAGHELFGIKTQHQITVLNIGALLVDKITTLSRPTIGYDQQPVDITKQTHDIGHLLLASAADDLAESFEQFPELMKFKLEHHKNGKKFNAADIISGVEKFVTSLLVFDPIFQLSTNARNHCGNFRGMYIGKNDYTNYKHANNILMIWLYSMYIKESIKPGFDIRAKSTELASIISKNRTNLHVMQHNKNMVQEQKYVAATLEKSIKNMGLANLYLREEIVKRTNWPPK